MFLGAPPLVKTFVGLVWTHCTQAENETAGIDHNTQGEKLGGPLRTADPPSQNGYRTKPAAESLDVFETLV